MGRRKGDYGPSEYSPPIMLCEGNSDCSGENSKKTGQESCVSVLQGTGQFLECAFVPLPGVVRGEGSLLVTHIRCFQAQTVFMAMPSLNSNEHALLLWWYTA